MAENAEVTLEMMVQTGKNKHFRHNKEGIIGRGLNCVVCWADKKKIVIYKIVVCDKYVNAYSYIQSRLQIIES